MADQDSTVPEHFPHHLSPATRSRTAANWSRRYHQVSEPSWILSNLWSQDQVIPLHILVRVFLFFDHDPATITVPRPTFTVPQSRIAHRPVFAFQRGRILHPALVSYAKITRQAITNIKQSLAEGHKKTLFLQKQLTKLNRIARKQHPGKWEGIRRTTIAPAFDAARRPYSALSFSCSYYSNHDNPADMDEDVEAEWLGHTTASDAAVIMHALLHYNAPQWMIAL